MGPTELAVQRLAPRASRLTSPIDEVDRRIILATQAGLPLARRPYQLIAAELGLEPEDVMRRLRRMLANGVIRRIGVVPNHYALGYLANAMTVWDVPDERAQRLGRRVGELRLCQSLLPPATALAAMALQSLRHGARSQPRGSRFQGSPDRRAARARQPRTRTAL